MWQDSEVRFDINSVQMQMRLGELLMDKLDMIEDSKGNSGDTGRLLITNLRIVWHSMLLPRINLSIGYNTIVTANSKNIHGNNTHALHILCSYRNCRYEFIFTNQIPKSSRNFTSLLGVYKAYLSSKVYREVKLRSGIIHESRLSVLNNEKVHSTLPGVWNLSTEQGTVGTFIVTNLRLVWFADMNNQFNVSLPYLTITNVSIRSSKFGPTLVVLISEAHGSLILGFRIDPMQKLYILHKEITSLLAAHEKCPIFGVEYKNERQVEAPPEFDVEGFTEIQENENEISNVIGLYFSEGGTTQRKPVLCNYLGLAAEEPRKGSSLQTLWELLPTA
ncbi:Bardet-Biedl syndrome 5 protein homolog [Orussus abietinus]|uniref:Bardet-Biedl syndrome 5 protein homolog n=1 Tax=Orussus abietinus TaxID=222816 RepID=UPI000C716060|nr:Bardet-Biedl syndrome 5 protein homolog [Orussus abietinus]